MAITWEVADRISRLPASNETSGNALQQITVKQANQHFIVDDTFLSRFVCFAAFFDRNLYSLTEYSLVLIQIVVN